MKRTPKEWEEEDAKIASAWRFRGLAILVVCFAFWIVFGLVLGYRGLLQ